MKTYPSALLILPTYRIFPHHTIPQLVRILRENTSAKILQHINSDKDDMLWDSKTYYTNVALVCMLLIGYLRIVSSCSQGQGRSGRHIACLPREHVGCSARRESSHSTFQTVQYSIYIYAFHLPLGILPSNTLPRAVAQ